MAKKEVNEILRDLVRACNYRDAVMASGHRDKLDVAVENYSMRLRDAAEYLEQSSGKGESAK